jgi:hypothetical protein
VTPRLRSRSVAEQLDRAGSQAVYLQR